MTRPVGIHDRGDVRDRYQQRLEPRGLSRCEAAAYIGVSPSMFDVMVRDARMPRPKRINSRIVWDRRQLDAAFESLPEKDETPLVPQNEWDAMT